MFRFLCHSFYVGRPLPIDLVFRYTRRSFLAFVQEIAYPLLGILSWKTGEGQKLLFVFDGRSRANLRDEIVGENYGGGFA